MNEGIHLDLDNWIVPCQIRKANLCRGLGNRYTPAGTEVLISAVAHNTHRHSRRRRMPQLGTSAAPLLQALPRGIHQHHLSATPGSATLYHYISLVIDGLAERLPGWLGTWLSCMARRYEQNAWHARWFLVAAVIN